jgi:hypothetical protein
MGNGGGAVLRLAAACPIVAARRDVERGVKV